MASRRVRSIIEIIVMTAMVAATLAISGAFVEAGSPPVRINSGGGEYTDVHGDRWLADDGFRGGWVETGNGNVHDTDDDALYQTQRVGMTGYATAVSDAGGYRVKLHFAELGKPHPGQRVFDVLAEGTTAVSRLDVAAVAHKNRAYIASFDVEVSDGQLDLTFVRRSGDPAVAAVEIIPPGSTGAGAGATADTTTTTEPTSTTTTAAPTTTTSTTVAPTTTTTTTPVLATDGVGPTVASALPKLSWAPPSLSNPTKVYVTNSSPYWLPTMDSTRDYEIVLPGRPGNPQTTPLNHGIGLVGGRNVVLIGGEIAVPDKSVEPNPEYRVGIKLRHQRGTVHIEGVKITNATDVINMDERYGAVVQLQNINGESSEVDSDTFHSDNLQTWAGPAELRVDGWTGISTFQGFFFNPDDPNFQNPSHPSPRLFDLRRVNIRHLGGAGYVYERIGSWPLVGSNLWGAHPDGKIVYTGYGPFPAVSTGEPVSDFVPEALVGIGYVSPGYA